MDQNQYYQYYNAYQQSTTNDSSSQAQPYDQSSSVQPYYDYSTQQYYSSYQHQQPTNDHSSSVQSYYSPQDYSNSYQYQYQPQSGPTGQYPAAVNPTQNAASQHSAYYPQPYVSVDLNRQTQPPSSGGRGGGGGGRGVRPFRGGGRGHGQPASRGKGRGQSGRRPPAVPSKCPPRVVWCELCRIDCSTPENLEFHKNGKRHKKNLQAQERLKNHANKTSNEQQSVRIQDPKSNPEHNNVQTVEAFGSQEATAHMDNSIPTSVAVNGDKNESEKHKNSEEKSKMLSAASSAENTGGNNAIPGSVAEAGNKNESEKQINPEEKSETFSAAYSGVRPRWNNNINTRMGFQGHGRGLKRSMRGGRGGRGGKFLRSNEGSRRPVEPLKSKELVPYICELCNVKCETQVVFNSHLAGKKHLANVKRFHDSFAAGSSSSSAIPQPNVGSQALLPQQGMTDPQVLLAQLLNVVLQQAQAQQAQPPEQAALLAQVQNLLTSQTHESEAAPEPVSKSASTAEAENLQISTRPEHEATSDGRTDPKTAEEASLSENPKTAEEASLSEKNDVEYEEEVAIAENRKEIPN